MRYRSKPEWLYAFLASWLLCPALLQAGDLTPHSAVYDVRIKILSGKLTTRLSATEAGYLAVHKVYPTGVARMLVDGSIEEIAGFSATDDGIEPSHYETNDTLTKDKTQANLRFDRQAQEIVGEISGEPFEGDLDERVFDRISIQYALMNDLIQGISDREYILFDFDEFKPLEVTLIGRKEVKVPAGTYDAIGIRHQAEGSSRVTTLWCVEALDFIPAIVEQHRKGKLNFRATLETYEREPPGGQREELSGQRN